MNWGLPVSVEIGGVSYEIRTDFRVILDIFVMLSDPDLSGTDRAEGILQMFYVSPEDIPPQHLQEAVDRFTWFQNGGKEQSAMGLSRDKITVCVYKGYIGKGRKEPDPLRAG